MRTVCVGVGRIGRSEVAAGLRRSAWLGAWLVLSLLSSMARADDDEGEAYLHCLEHMASAGGVIVTPCQWADQHFWYRWSSEDGLTGLTYRFPFGARCSDRAPTSLPAEPAPPVLICETGCTYAAVDEEEGGDGSEVMYQPTGAVCPAPATDADPDQSLGAPCRPDCGVGDPINLGTGNKYEIQTEYVGRGVFPLEFTWTYTSRASGLSERTQGRMLGAQRWHGYLLSVRTGGDGATVTAYVARPDGNVEPYDQSSAEYQAGTAVWQPRAGNAARLTALFDATGQRSGWQRVGEDGRIEDYNATGRLTQITDRHGLSQTLSYDGQDRLSTVTDPQGRQLVFQYNASNQLSTLVLPDGGTVSFLYDSPDYATANLASVIYPDGTSKAYWYNEPGYVHDANWHLLTGQFDEAGVRLSSTQYDQSVRAIGTWLIGEVETYRATYYDSADHSYVGTVDIAGPEGLQERRTYTAVAGRPRLTSRTLNAPDQPARTTQYTYDSQGRLDQTIATDGVVTDTDTDSNGLLTQVVRALGRPEQQTERWQWDSDLRVPTQIDRDGQRHTVTYNARGQALTATVTETATGTHRTVTHTYCEQIDITASRCPLLGLRTATDGPRSDVEDVTYFRYYPSDDASCAGAPSTCPHRIGDLWQLTDAAGQTTEVLTYDGAGRPRALQDRNGTVTDLRYDPRGRLTRKLVRGADPNSEADDAITQLDYDPIGQLTALTDPDGSRTTFSYDAAHRLTQIADSAGNTINYTLDSAGRRVQDDTKDAQGLVTRTLSRLYSAYGDLQTLADAQATPTDFTYDAAGRLASVTDAFGRRSERTVDGLGRITQAIANASGGEAAWAVSQFQYDARDNLTTVIDPNGLTTTTTYNGFDEPTELSSPDTGIRTFTYDDAGNRASQQDARGITTHFTYDALNRLLSQTGPTPTQAITLTYDTAPAECASGETSSLGRLAEISDESGRMAYCYNARGQLVRQVNAITNGPTLTLGATYTGADRLIAWTYPSQAIVTYQRNSAGRIKGVAAKLGSRGTQVTLVANASYLPFGPLTSLTFGNGRTLTTSYDPNYGIDRIEDSAASSGGLSQDASLDAVGHLTALTEAIDVGTTTNRQYTYDGLNRLTTHTTDGSPTEAFTLDATGNRLSKTPGTNPASAYSYASDSHHLNSVDSTTRTYDAAGNTLSIGSGRTGQSFSYDDYHRLREIKVGNQVKASYRTNALGQRVAKLMTPTTASRFYLYDQFGHLMGEYKANGTRIAEYVWLDDTLIAILSDHDQSSYQFVETDHLGTPRAVIHPSKNTVIWRWTNATAFGEHAPQSDPDGNGKTYTLNLRFAGQYYDAESGFYYNGHRTYDPATGRYLESDPIGLAGGMSTYGYANQDPLSFIDPSGLASCTYTISTGSLVCTPDNIIRAPVDIAVAAGNNGGGMACKNNPNCTHLSNRGPLPQGEWSWDNDAWTGKPNGRVLVPAQDTQTYGRREFRTHSCINAFGPSLGPDKFCSEGCITGSAADIRKLNALLDAEHGSTLSVVSYPTEESSFYELPAYLRE